MITARENPVPLCLRTRREFSVAMQAGTDLADCAACGLDFDIRLASQRYYILPIWIRDGSNGDGPESVHNIESENAARIWIVSREDAHAIQVAESSAVVFWEQQSRYDGHGEQAEQRILDLSSSMPGTGVWRAELHYHPVFPLIALQSCLDRADVQQRWQSTL